MASFIDYGILMISFFLSLILLLLICLRTPAIMSSYRPLLLCGWFADFSFNVCALIGRPLYYYHDGVMFMIPSMFVSTIKSPSINLIGVIVWIYGFMQLMVMPVLQFLARYLMVVK